MFQSHLLISDLVPDLVSGLVPDPNFELGLDLVVFGPVVVLGLRVSHQFPP